MLVLLRDLPREETQNLGLVLTSAAIEHRIQHKFDGSDIYVEPVDHARALLVINRYLDEDDDLQRLKERQVLPPAVRSYSGVWVAVLPLLTHIAVSLSSDPRAITKLYGSSALHIMSGELYRTATSLLLHGGPGHLAGNMVGLALFGSAYAGLTGRGVAWLAILLTGIVGNFINAAMFGANHLSIGASTAVFGAIGLLAGHQFISKMSLPGQRIKAWLPLGGGLALLGFLGSSAKTDVTAHLFGFMAGLAFGLLYPLLKKGHLPASWQWMTGGIAVTLLGLSGLRLINLSLLF